MVLAFAQFIAIWRTADSADRGEGSICQHHQLRITQDELYPELGRFGTGSQAVALDAGRQVVSSLCVFSSPEPQGYEPSLEFGQGAGEGAAGIELFVPEPLVALE